MSRKQLSTLGKENARSQVDLVQQLRECRVAAGMTPEMLAERMGVDASEIYKFEKGGTDFRASFLRAYAKRVDAYLKLEARTLQLRSSSQETKDWETKVVLSPSTTKPALGGLTYRAKESTRYATTGTGATVGTHNLKGAPGAV